MTAVPAGHYRVRITARDPHGYSVVRATTVTVSPPAPSSDHRFPVAGPHSFAGGGGRFGAPRAGGYAHEGQDVPAACGTPLVAARGGLVKMTGQQARAGNYLVIDADKTGWDMVYMHLRDPALVAKGSHVATGQTVGFVGDTGDAEGCHLHFEQWSAPGWYTGGRAVDPLAALMSWDTES